MLEEENFNTFFPLLKFFLPLEKRIHVMTSLLCVWNQYLKYVESSATNFVLVMRASRGLTPIQYTRRVGRNGTLEATRGAPVPATVMSGRLLKSEMMRTILGRNLCRVSSICCMRKFETATNTLVVQPLNWNKNSFLYATPSIHLHWHPLHTLNVLMCQATYWKKFEQNWQ